MKLFLLILLFVVFIFFAVFIYLRYYYKFIFYKDMVFLCKMLKNNISFNKDTIDKLLYSAEHNLSNTTKSILNSNVVDNKSILLNKEEKFFINRFIKSLGSGDVKFELNNITYYENEFNDKKIISKELLDKDGKMYLKLIIGVGLALFIILI